MKTVDINCKGYSVKADVYEGDQSSPILLSLIGRTSNRKRRQYSNFFPRVASDLGITTVIFDYSGHGDSPFDLAELCNAQHSLEVITVYDWIAAHYPNRKIFVLGSSYGCYMAARLYNFRKVEGIIFRAPAIYDSDEFYTKMKDENQANTDAFRKNSDMMRSHPYFRNAKRLNGRVLVVVHEDDEQIPKEVTDVYSKVFEGETVIAKGYKHSLNDSNDEEVENYNEIIFDWLKQNT